MERHEILEAMSGLKLYGMRASFDEIAGKGLARRDEIYPLIASLIRAEHTHRQARSISYRIGAARFPVLKDLDKFVFADTPVDEGLVRELATGAFLDAKRNAIFIGGTGTGKTHLAIGVASAVIRTRARGRFFNLVDLVNQLEQEKAAGRSGRLPVADNLPNAVTPIYRNLWDHIGKKMPKAGRAKGGKGNPQESCRFQAGLSGRRAVPTMALVSPVGLEPTAPRLKVRRAHRGICPIWPFSDPLQTLPDRRPRGAIPLFTHVRHLPPHICPGDRPGTAESAPVGAELCSGGQLLASAGRTACSASASRRNLPNSAIAATTARDLAPTDIYRGATTLIGPLAKAPVWDRSLRGFWTASCESRARTPTAWPGLPRSG